ncbi:MAG: 2-succinyl-5-enolpyruvyl-6-hydroxy-3-cyclohexene-1-carboxylic-acid synthase [Bacteroidota bacterium]
MNLQAVFNLIEICAKHNLERAIISPGSRNAPLTIALSRNPKIKCRSISDERSAAFIGLGIAQQLKKPTILCCTSGSATLNYAPAVAEAFFQQIPLLILTADRPPEWIDQYDGQTIRQNDIYGQHVKRSFFIPVDLENRASEVHAYRIMNDAINCALERPQGPVHVNVPFREPFYPSGEIDIVPDHTVKAFTQTKVIDHAMDWQDLKEIWTKFDRKVIVGGQEPKNDDLLEPLNKLFKEHKVPVLGDVVSNLHTIDEVIAHSDLFLGSDKKGLHESLKPDLLVTFGKSTISKNLKLMLRAFGPQEHWHIQENGDVADTYNSLTRIIRTAPKSFFNELARENLEPNFSSQKQENYCNIWLIEERKARRVIAKFFDENPWSEIGVVRQVLKKVDFAANVHLANSMAVRYANFIGINNTMVDVFANRGTSGIDGSTSTAVGVSLESEKTNLLITGDVAFFYDRNAFWHNYDLKNLRVLLLNNSGGGIFRMIKGPDQLPELKEFFETKQALTAESLAQEYNLDYLQCDRPIKLNNYIDQFLENDGKGKIFEFNGSSEDASRSLRDFKIAFNEAV